MRKKYAETTIASFAREKDLYYVVLGYFFDVKAIILKHIEMAPKNLYCAIFALGLFCLLITIILKSYRKVWFENCSLYEGLEQDGSATAELQPFSERLQSPPFNYKKPHGLPQQPVLLLMYLHIPVGKILE